MKKTTKQFKEFGKLAIMGGVGTAFLSGVGSVGGDSVRPITNAGITGMSTVVSVAAPVYGGMMALSALDNLSPKKKKKRY